MDINMVSAAAKKHQKYRDLRIAMKKQFKLHKIQTVPIVIGPLRLYVRVLTRILQKCHCTRVQTQSRKKFFW
eukprot:13050969-Ditylum_brightwellii.AAC.1